MHRVLFALCLTTIIASASAFASSKPVECAAVFNYLEEMKEEGVPYVYLSVSLAGDCTTEDGADAVEKGRTLLAYPKIKDLVFHMGKLRSLDKGDIVIIRIEKKDSGLVGQFVRVQR